MSRFSFSGVVVLCFSFLLTGCSSPENRYKAEYKKSLKALSELYYFYYKEATKAANERDKYKLPDAELREIVGRIEEIKKKIDDAEPQDEQIKEKVLKRYSPMLETVLTNIGLKRAKVGPSSIADAKGGADSAALKASDDLCKTFETLTRPEKDKEKDKKKNP